jgi:hypothetical protein
MEKFKTPGAAAARINTDWSLNGRAYLRGWMHGEERRSPEALGRVRRFFALWAAQEAARG